MYGDDWPESPVQGVGVISVGVLVGGVVAVFSGVLEAVAVNVGVEVAGVTEGTGRVEVPVGVEVGVGVLLVTGVRVGPGGTYKIWPVRIRVELPRQLAFCNCWTVTPWAWLKR